MKRTLWLPLSITTGLLMLAVILVLTGQQSAFARANNLMPGELPGDSFVYQGRLLDDGVPYNGNCDFQFSLWTAGSGGQQIGVSDEQTLSVSEGLFMATLNDHGDFGVNPFDGQSRWLEVAVDCESAGFTTLSPRQALAPAPIAASLPGLYTIQNITSTNIIGGHISNTISTTVVGGVIAGGGNMVSPNQVLGEYGAVGGGDGNRAAGGWSVVSGGGGNYAGGSNSTISGGQDNSSFADLATIGGGQDNQVLAAHSTIGGGLDNIVSGTTSVVAGGTRNLATNFNTTVAGGVANEANGDYSAVVGGWDNAANGAGAFVGGGRLNRANGDQSVVVTGWDSQVDGLRSVIGSGFQNEILSNYSFIGTGAYNTITDTATVGFIGSGAYNSITGTYGTIGGGEENSINGNYGTIPGGKNNQVDGDFATAGGWGALADDYGQWAYAAGTFSDGGLAQGSHYVMRGTVTEGTNVILALDGNSDWIGVPEGRVILFEALIIGTLNDASLTSNVYRYTIAVKNIPGSGPFLFVNDIEIIFEDDPSWGVGAGIDSVTPGSNFSFNAVGDLGSRWVAYVQAVELSY
jgi:hypothetical protein